MTKKVNPIPTKSTQFLQLKSTQFLQSQPNSYNGFGVNPIPTNADFNPIPTTKSTQLQLIVDLSQDYEYSIKAIFKKVSI